MDQSKWELWPDRFVAWNSWIVRKPSDFQEYWAGEAAGALILPDAEYFGDLHWPLGGKQVNSKHDATLDILLNHTIGRRGPEGVDAFTRAKWPSAPQSFLRPSVSNQTGGTPTWP